MSPMGRMWWETNFRQRKGKLLDLIMKKIRKRSRERGKICKEERRKKYVCR